jgi:hypothetical protein
MDEFFLEVEQSVSLTSVDEEIKRRRPQDDG